MKANEFKNLLARTKRVMCKGKSLMPVMDCVFISGGYMTAYGSENNNVDCFRIKHEVFDNINAVVNFKELVKVITKLKRIDISLKEKNGKLVIGCSKGEFKLNANVHNIDDGVEMPEEFNHIGSLNQENVDLIRKAFPFVSKDQLRPVMCNVLVEAEGTIIASDGRKMLFRESNVDITENIMIGRNLVDRPCSVYMTEDGAYLKFESENEVLFCSTCDRPFPDWRRVVPKKSELTHRVSVNKSEYLDKIDCCLTACNKESMSGVLDLKKKNSRIYSKDNDYEREFAADFPNLIKGDKIRIGFSLRLMQDIINSLDGDEVVIDLTDPTRTMIINKNILLMPMIVDE